MKKRETKTNTGIKASSGSERGTEKKKTRSEGKHNREPKKKKVAQVWMCDRDRKG